MIPSLFCAVAVLAAAVASAAQAGGFDHVSRHLVDTSRTCTGLSAPVTRVSMVIAAPRAADDATMVEVSIRDRPGVTLPADLAVAQDDLPALASEAYPQPTDADATAEPKPRRPTLSSAVAMFLAAVGIAGFVARRRADAA